MPSQQDSAAVSVARAHVEAWGRHDYEAARESLASDVQVLAVSVDPQAPPDVDRSGADAYIDGLIQFGQIVLPGTTKIESSIGDDTRALLQVSSRVKLGPDAPEMVLHGARLYLLDANQKIKKEQVIFFVAPQGA